MATISMNNTTPLLALPAELRLQIYHYVFDNAIVRHTCRPTSKVSSPNRPDWYRPFYLQVFPAASLLLVNRLISNESIPIFWALATIQILAYDCNDTTLIRPGPKWQQKAAVSRVHVRGAALYDALFRQAKDNRHERERGCSHDRPPYAEPGRFFSNLARAPSLHHVLLDVRAEIPFDLGPPLIMREMRWIVKLRKTMPLVKEFRIEYSAERQAHKHAQKSADDSLRAEVNKSLVKAAQTGEWMIDCEEKGIQIVHIGEKDDTNDRMILFRVDLMPDSS